MNEKICRDCKWYIDEFDGEYHTLKCHCPKTAQIDLVTGRTLYHDCEYQRYTVTIQGTCGARGDFFEAKNADIFPTNV